MFEKALRNLAQRYQVKENQERFANRPVIENPVVFEYRVNQIITAVEFPAFAMPQTGDVVEVRLFGGKCLVLVNVAKYGDYEENTHILFIEGKLIPV